MSTDDRHAAVSCTLRPATPNDAGFVNEVEDICMRGYAEALWGEWTPSALKYGFDATRHRIVQIDGSDVGCIDLWHKGDHWLLNKFYLLPQARGQGLGAELLRLLIDETRPSGLPLRLSVLTPNVRALSFYQRDGFREISRTPERIMMEFAG